MKISDSDMVQIIKARFMHQRKDRAVYERIIDEGICFAAQQNSESKFMMFTMPLYCFYKFSLSVKWDKSCRTVTTFRSVQFVDTNNKVLFTLSAREINAAILRFPQTSPIAILCGVMVDKHEASELKKIFSNN